MRQPLRRNRDAFSGEARVHLVDGTYELFRHFYALPPHSNADGAERAAVRGVLHSLLGLVESGATHLAVATDQVIESFRNDLWSGYKSSVLVDPAILAQFLPLEDALSALGMIVWPMTTYEADDALASGAAGLALLDAVAQVVLCSPDKDLAQCVTRDRVVALHRRTGLYLDEAGVVARFGVPPASIPDYLALVGDSADGFPGLAGWGPKSAAAVLAHFGRLEAIPHSYSDWPPGIRGAARLSQVLARDMELALLFRNLATLRTDLDLVPSLDRLCWVGPTPEFDGLCRELRDDALAERARVAAELHAARGAPGREGGL